jgi:hypothetical protein
MRAKFVVVAVAAIVDIVVAAIVDIVVAAVVDIVVAAVDGVVVVLVIGVGSIKSSSSRDRSGDVGRTVKKPLLQLLMM